MKAHIAILTTVIFSMTAMTFHAYALERHFLSDSTKTLVFANAKALLNRLDIINATDKSAFNKRQKKQLRKEARIIKSELKELRGGRYIPVGALVLALIVPLVVFQVRE